MDHLAEQALIASAKAGDRLAFERLLEATLRPATRLAYAMLHDRSEAEDAFQEAALRAWRRMGNVREGTAFAPWFMGIVANQCREVRRSRWWQLIRLPNAIAAPRIDETAWLDGEDLRRAVANLPPDQRSAVVMHFHLDMPIGDVAIALGISEAGVKTRINRALKRLRPAVRASDVQVNG
ncbi:MAG TPA: RNA polymerase sigma factor [Candidatus Dormibacteraeota bacterium]|nr:RNA polymerase sigma factor [Candidatus Dormibacteraeota bacterium]